MDEFLEMGPGLNTEFAGMQTIRGKKKKKKKERKKENGIDFIKENRKNVQKKQKENTRHNVIKAKAEKFQK